MPDPDAELHDVGAVTDFPLGEGRRVRLGKHDVAVFHLDDGFFACKNLCPHQGDPLHHGRLEGCAVICLGHDWKFDLRTGDCVAGGGVAVQSRVRTYPVRIVDGRVQLER